MPIVLENALLVDLDTVGVEPGAIRLDGHQIVARGRTVPRQPGDEVVDCGGAVVLPGLVNGHAHLYSALAAGMPPPRTQPRAFAEVLEHVWWRLDRALDTESIAMSGRIGAIDALRCGTTTLIDHHASPTCIHDSLDALERGIADAGLRGVLCYETTDRNGRAGREAGLEENRRYAAKCQQNVNGRFAAMIGGHALFTLDDDTLRALAELSAHFEVGVHLHVAEDPCDEDRCQAEHQMFLVDRLAAHGLLAENSLFAHGTHLDLEAMERVATAGVKLAHNPRSNMNNGVGYTPVGSFRGPILLGTDGIGSDLLSEAKFAWFKMCDEHAGLGPIRVLAMLAASARHASAALDVPLGKLTVGAAADIVLTDYRPATPLTSDNLPGHFIYALGSNHVRSVLVNGIWALRDRVVQTCREADVRAAAREITDRLWRRMAEIK